MRLGDPIQIAPIYEPVFSTGMLRVEICYNETFAGQQGCDVIPLSSVDINDTVFELSRLFLTLGNFFGCFFTLVLTSSIVWESINLRPIGFGFMFTYFLQSFSMLFFDTEICNESNCRVGAGCIYCIVTCLRWILACIATAKMEAFKVKALRRRRRLEKRRLKQERKRKAILREASQATAATDSSTSSDSSRELDIETGNPGEPEQETTTLGPLYDC